uniref:hypothetical protein n=1 Tax=Pseudonocardia nigra TaxID=1921578 RepID=UPI001C603F34
DPHTFVRDRPDRASPRATKKAGDFPARKDQPRVVHVTRRIQLPLPPTAVTDLTQGHWPQNLREYDPEWGRAFVSGSASVSCDHATMLARVTVPVLLTHHFRAVDEQTDRLTGALSDVQAQRVRQLVTEAGQRLDYRSFPEMPHSMHEHDPKRYVETVLDWVSTLDR